MSDKIDCLDLLKENKLKITGWTNFDNEKYADVLVENDEQYEKIKNMIVEEIKNKGYKFDGYYHQHGIFGVPVFNDKFKMTFSMRTWGTIMSEALGNKYSYLDWAWSSPEGIELVIPKGEIYDF